MIEDAIDVIHELFKETNISDIKSKAWLCYNGTPFICVSGLNWGDPTHYIIEDLKLFNEFWKSWELLLLQEGPKLSCLESIGVTWHHN